MQMVLKLYKARACVKLSLLFVLLLLVDLFGVFLRQSHCIAVPGMEFAGLSGLASLLSYPHIGVTGVGPHVLLIIPKYELCHVGLLNHSVIFRNVSIWGPGSVNFECK